jgi:hypothetical protein
MSIAYRNGMYIAEKIFPLVRTPNQSNKFYKFSKSAWFRDEAQKRAPGGASEGGGFSLSTDSFFCDEIAFHTMLEDEVRDNADGVLAIESAKVNFVTEKILLNLEIRIALHCATTGNWGATATPTNKWNDYDASDPLTDLETGIASIKGATGMQPNKIVIPDPVWQVLKHHPAIIDRLPVTGMRTAKVAHLQELLEIDEILIGSALKATTDEGVAEASQTFTNIWGEVVWIGYVAPAPARETPSAGYTFVWPRDGMLRGIRRWRDEDHHSDKIEAFMSFDEVVTGKDLGYVITNTLA